MITVHRDRFKEKIAIVTGAGSGIGKAIVERLSAEGATVIANDLHSDGLQTLRGDRIHSIAADVSDPATSELLVHEATDVSGGRIDLLFNNAGISIPDDAADYTWENWRRVLGVNLDAAFLVATAVGRVMIEQGDGSIVNTASVAGLFATPRGLAYTVSKHGIVALTKCLAYEWGPYGVRVNALAPGITESGFNVAIRRDHPERWDARTALLPLRRGSTAEEQAATALFLASEDASYTTGTVAIVDGGGAAVHSSSVVPYK